MVPKTLRQLGDPLLERSRAQAQVKLDGLIFEAQSRKTAEQHLEQLYELKSGCDLMQIPLKDMEREWDMLPSKKGRSKRHIESQHATIRQFREFLNENHASVKHMSQVTAPMARAWMYALEKEDARKTPVSLHERRKQVVRLHRKGYGLMKITELTGLSWGAVNTALKLYEEGELPL